ncbi:MAG: SLBB domain-containing protein [Gemmatimonadetes bacterium]|nr:SLBB domain-containing protein [Gemmatimonadota bacterium]
MPTSIFALACALVFCGLAGPASAQSLESLIRLGEEEVKLQPLSASDLPALNQDVTAGKARLPGSLSADQTRIGQDRDIDPDAYIVGPNDVLQLYIWGEFDKPYTLQVDPEGYVLIPTVGSFHISGLSLTAAKERLSTAVQNKYPNVDISISLVSMRFFTAYVTGAVLNEGSFTIYPTTRVLNIIKQAGGFRSRLQHIELSGQDAGGATNPNTGRRSIQLIHRDGTSERVDLDMFLATGDLTHNPYVRMGDMVHVSFRKHSVSIFGAVNEEGEYEFLPGDTLGDLVTLAKGLNRSKPLISAELWRFQEGTDQAEVIELGSAKETLEELNYETIRHIELRPNDAVFIRAQSLWQSTHTVVISGEVKFQGRYRIEPGVTRIKDVVAAAGGLTDEASLIGARVIRTRVRAESDPQLEQLKRQSEVAGLTDMNIEDRAYLKTKTREEKGRIAVDFERLFVDGDEGQNILLASGDVIFFPMQRHTINVSGQVQRAGLIDYEPGRKVSYYITKAGGYLHDADKRNARLVRARTGVREQLLNPNRFHRHQWSSLKGVHERLKDDLIVEVGDEIWVPQKERVDYWTLTREIIPTVFNILTLAALAKGAFF